MAQNNSPGVTRVEFDILRDDVRELHKVYDTINRQTVVVEKLALEMKYLREDQKQMNERICTLEQKPAKRYDTVVTSIITSIIGIIIGAIAVLINIKK